MSKSQLVVRRLARADSSGRASAEQFDFSDEFLSEHFLVMDDLWPNTALEPTPTAPCVCRFGFLVFGSHRRRGSALDR